MTFLAKLGGYLAKGIAVLAGLGPLIQPWLGSNAPKVTQAETTATNDLTAIGQIVLSVEAIVGAGNGPAKLQAVAGQALNILKNSELIAGHEVGNEALLAEAASDITNGVAKALNSLKSDKVKSSGTPVVASVTPIIAPVAPAPATTSGIPGVTS